MFMSSKVCPLRGQNEPQKRANEFCWVHPRKATQKPAKHQIHHSSSSGIQTCVFLRRNRYSLYEKEMSAYVHLEKRAVCDLLYPL